MALLIELTQVRSGHRRVLLDENAAGGPRCYRGAVGADFYAGTVLVEARDVRPEVSRQMMFDLYASVMGGRWREVQPGVWLHGPRVQLGEKA